MMSFGMNRVAPLDALVAFVAVVGGGSLEDRTKAAFWTLDRDGAGYLTLEQLQRFSGLLVAVAAAGHLVLGLPLLPRSSDTRGTSSQQQHHQQPQQQQRPEGAAGPDAGGPPVDPSRAQSFNTSPLASVSRGLIDSALKGAFREHCLPAEGPNGPPARLTVERLALVVQSAAEYVTMAVVYNATAASMRPYDSNVHPHQPHAGHSLPALGSGYAPTSPSHGHSRPHRQSHPHQFASHSPGHLHPRHHQRHPSYGQQLHSQPPDPLAPFQDSTYSGQQQQQHRLNPAQHPYQSPMSPFSGRTGGVEPVGWVQAGGSNGGAGAAAAAAAPGPGPGPPAAAAAAASVGGNASAFRAGGVGLQAFDGITAASGPTTTAGQAGPWEISPHASMQLPGPSPSSAGLQSAVRVLPWSRSWSSSFIAANNASLRARQSASGSAGQQHPPPVSGGGGSASAAGGVVGYVGHGLWAVASTVGHLVFGMGRRSSTRQQAEAEPPGESPASASVLAAAPLAGSSLGAAGAVQRPGTSGLYSRSAEATGSPAAAAAAAADAQSFRPSSSSVAGGSTGSRQAQPLGAASVTITMATSGPGPGPGPGPPGTLTSMPSIRQLGRVSEHPDTASEPTTSPIQSPQPATALTSHTMPPSTAAGGGADAIDAAARPSARLEVATLAAESGLALLSVLPADGSPGAASGVASPAAAAEAVALVSSGGGGGGGAPGSGAGSTGGGVTQPAGRTVSGALRMALWPSKRAPVPNVGRASLGGDALGGSQTTQGLSPNLPRAASGGVGGAAGAAEATPSGREGALDDGSFSGRRRTLTPHGYRTSAAAAAGVGAGASVADIAAGFTSQSPQQAATPSPDTLNHRSFVHTPNDLDEAANRAAVAAKAEALAAASRGGAPAAAAATGGGGAGREAAAPAPGGAGVVAGAGGTVLPPLQRAIRSSVQQAGVRLFLHCGLCLLSIIALLLTDAALVAWIYLDRRQRLSLSLVIVAATNAGLVLLVLVVSIVRSCMADRAAALEAAAAARQAAGGAGGGGGGASGGIVEFVLGNFVAPALRTLGWRGPAGGPAPEDGEHGGGWGARLRMLWATIGRVAGFDSALGVEASQNTADGPATRTSSQMDTGPYGYPLPRGRSGRDLEAGPGGMWMGGVGGAVGGHGTLMAGGGGGAVGAAQLGGGYPMGHERTLSGGNVPGLGSSGAGVGAGYGQEGVAMMRLEHMGVGVGVAGQGGMEGGSPGLGSDLRDSSRMGDTGVRQRQRGTAVPNQHSNVATMHHVGIAYPAM